MKISTAAAIADAAALARRARFAERGEADQSGGESVKRAGETVEQLAAQSPRHPSRLLVIRLEVDDITRSSVHAVA